MDSSTYLFDVIKVNDSKEAVNTALKNIVEGCVFIDPIGFRNTRGKINSMPVLLCSETKNPGYKEFQRINVTVKNVAKTPNPNNTPKVYVYDTRMKTQGVEPIFAFINGKDLTDGVKRADITVYHDNGKEDSIRIEAQSIELADWIKITDVNKPLSERWYDNRSLTSEKYVTHKDTFIKK